MSRMTNRRIAFTVVAVLIVIGAIGIVMAIGNDKPKPESANELPVCRAQQIAVQLGSSLKLSSKYPNANQLVPVFFHNHGPTCHLRSGGPVAQASLSVVLGRPINSLDASFPALIPQSFGAVTIRHSDEAEALFEVWKAAPSNGSKVEQCIPKTATRLSIGGYALPVGSERVFSRKIFDVCFADVGKSQRLNSEIIWLDTSG